jgi:2-methylcitrate dehydratase PrpD
MGETAVLAEYLAGLNYTDLPAEVVERTKEIVMEIAACGLAGHGSWEAQVLLDIMQEIGGKPECTVIGYPTKLTFLQAAQVNRVLTNMIDYDDTIIAYMTGHLGSVLVPVALAVGEHVKASSQDIISALVAGYETVFRLREAVNPSEEAFSRNFQERIDSGLGLGVTAVAGKLFGLNAGQLADALGLTGRVRTWRVPHQDRDQAQGGMARWMKITGGDVVIPGIQGALLARRGFPGERTILDQNKGYQFFVGSDNYDAARLTSGLGMRHAVMKAGFKLYSACRLTSSTLEAVSTLVSENNIQPVDVAEIVVKVQKEVTDNFAIYEPEHMIQAQFSLPYVVSMVLLGEPTGPNWYTEDKLKDPRARELRYKVKIVEDPAATNAGWGKAEVEPMSTVEIEMRDGRHFLEKVEHTKGEPENPFSRQDHVDKLRNMAAWAGMKTERINDLIRTLDRLEDVASISELTALLVP